MHLIQCPTCDHINPAGSTLCNGCRLPLPSVSWHLAPCPRCGALNGVTATPCWACNADLEIPTTGLADSSLLDDRDADAVLPPSPASKVAGSSALPLGTKTFRRQHFGLIIGSAVLATLAVSGYSAYQQRSIVAAGPAATPSVRADRDLATADDAKEANADKRAELRSIATSLSPVPPAAAARATANKEGVDRDAVKPPDAASAVSAAVKRQQATNAAARTERPPPSLGPCTEAIAALGLCTPEPEPEQ